MGLQIRLESVDHEYGRTEDSVAVRALQGIDLVIPAGRFVVLMGPSGSGKSTLLNLLGAVDRPTSGRIFLDDEEISTSSERELTLMRRRRIGFVFQFFNLIPTFTVRENVAFPLHLNGVPGPELARRAGKILDEVGLSGRADHYPNELSGGEMQRVAIARAVVHEPDLVIADEPTGNLDTKTGDAILDLLGSIHSSRGPTIVMATHSDRAASRGDSIIELLDGMIRSRRGAR